jgi:hypothetical protein
MRVRASSAAALLALALSWPHAASAADETYEKLNKSSVVVSNLKRILLPFVATCDREKNHFRKLFCSALNERLKAQHQSKVYRSTYEPSAAGPLIVKFKAKPKPAIELTIRGCLTCTEPMLEREGGDVSKGRFFLFKTPMDIKIRRGKVLYDLGDIDVKSTTIELPPTMTEKKFNEQVLPFLRVDLLYRPVAGTTMVGKGRYKYGVITFELVGHRVYDRCGGVVYATAPTMSGKFLVDKTDMTCPQNQPKKVVVKPKLPAAMPQERVRALMEQVTDDLRACHEMFGVTGDTPVEVVVAPDGKVKTVKVSGKLAGSATAQCVERLVKELPFPKFAGSDARLQWPLAVRN